MPIKNSITGNIPYLEKYDPFKLPAGIIEAVTVSDMFTYDLKSRNTSTNIEYKLGSSDVYIKGLNIKNITTNVDLEISIRYFKNIFFIKSDGLLQTREFGSDGREIKTVLGANTNRKFDIFLNNSLIDVGVYNNSVSCNIVVVVKNLQNGQIATKLSNVALYESLYFPRTVRIE